MARIKYYYDTETCRYERVKVSKSDVFINALGILCLCAVFGAVLAGLYLKYFPSERVTQLTKENEELHFYYGQLKSELSGVQEMLANLQERDDKVYRMIYETDPIAPSVRAAGIGGSERYSDILNKDLEEEVLILDAKRKIDILKRRMYVQTTSYDELMDLARNKSEMLASIPAIQPVSNKDLKRLASGFGYRIHPIYKVRKLHTGVDFSAPTGTPVFSSGDGVVIKVERNRSRRGYGNQIEVDHGFNYITKYAHLSAFDVKVGDKVKRGQVIGKVGSTGASTAPHLHYEVIYKGKKIDPVDYFFNDLTLKQFEEITKQAAIENQSFDYDNMGDDH